jgi:hypothetical protein
MDTDISKFKMLTLHKSALLEAEAIYHAAEQKEGPEKIP